MPMKSVGFMRVIGIQKLLIFGAILLVNYEIIVKNHDGAFPPKNFPIALKLLVGLKKIKGVQKWYGHPLFHAKFGGDPPLHGGVRNKSLVFLFLFVCLSGPGS